MNIDKIMLTIGIINFGHILKTNYNTQLLSALFNSIDKVKYKLMIIGATNDIFEIIIKSFYYSGGEVEYISFNNNNEHLLPNCQIYRCSSELEAYTMWYNNVNHFICLINQQVIDHKLKILLKQTLGNKNCHILNMI